MLPISDDWDPTRGRKRYRALGRDRKSRVNCIGSFAVGIGALWMTGAALEAEPASDPGQMITGTRPVDVDLYLPIDVDSGQATFTTESRLKLKEYSEHRYLASEPFVITMHPAAAEEGTIGKLGVSPKIREQQIRAALQRGFSGNFAAYERPQLHISPDPIEQFGPRVSVATVSAKFDKPYTLTKIFYATDRGSSGSNSTETFYDDNSNETDHLSYGIATIRLDEQLDPPQNGWWAWVTRFFRHDPRPPLTETRTNVAFQNFDQLSAEIREALSKTKQDELLIYVHGFRTSFDDDVRSGVVLGYLTKFRGPVLAYSWPSRGALADYDADYESADRTIPRLATLLANLSHIHELKKVHVIAHSMGTRVLFWALQRSQLHLGQIVMVAGDTSRKDFVQYFNQLKRDADRFTLYSTNTDVALYASSHLHVDPRIGFWKGENGPFRMPGLESIDATPAVTDILSHGYFLNSELPKTDIIYVLQSKAAEDRGCVRWHDANQHDFLVYGCP